MCVRWVIVLLCIMYGRRAGCAHFGSFCRLRHAQTIVEEPLSCSHGHSKRGALGHNAEESQGLQVRGTWQSIL